MNPSDIPRIIVVDDEQSIIEGLTRILRGSGCEIVGHSSPGDALERIKTGGADILLTDLMMPGMNGIELLTRALAVDPTLTCIVMTGQATVDTAIKAMKSGAFDYVQKPFEPQVILRRPFPSMGFQRS